MLIEQRAPIYGLKCFCKLKDGPNEAFKFIASVFTVNIMEAGCSFMGSRSLIYPKRLTDSDIAAWPDRDSLSQV